MARQKNGEGVFGVFALIIGLPMLLGNWIHTTLGIAEPITFVFFCVVFVIGLWFYFADQKRKFRAIQIANIDAMSGIEFERYLQKLLVCQGYNVTMTAASGDLGVDLVATRGNERIAIQAKRYNSKISRRAISDAVAGMQHYRCNHAMVITNNFFTPGAITLARSTRCTLIDRNTLAKWIINLQVSQGNRVTEGDCV
jgi:HJR/Mrr/RecB family endonuclease